GQRRRVAHPDPGRRMDRRDRRRQAVRPFRAHGGRDAWRPPRPDEAAGPLVGRRVAPPSSRFIRRFPAGWGKPRALGYSHFPGVFAWPGARGGGGYGMEPLEELDPLATVFPEEDVPRQGISPLGGSVETRAPRRESQLQVPRPPFPVDPILAPVFRDFEQSGVRWCLLGLPEDRPQGADEEVVALVDRSALSTARRVLKANGFAPIPTWGRGPLARFVRYNPRTD